MTFGVFFVDIILLVLTLLALSFGLRLHALLRAGELGRSWQFVVWGVVLLVLREILRLGNQITPIPSFLFIERICDAGFMVLLCFALWRQWSAFDFLQARRRKRTHWNQIAKSIATTSEQESNETKGREGEKEWREQWYRKA
ncbi:MAG: hypothetical protein NZ805_08455 [Armatimonadetes bacterium]|nr:hypothetical protein [Armatimonadota bacterium]MDW8028724.1 hypothetical protein [Armatimonadota bacterium]